MEEKNRKKTRFLANFDGLYRFSKTKEWLDCYIYDISETGTLIRMKQTLVIGDILEICLDSENTKDIIIGKVANVKGQVAGIEFTSKNIQPIIDKAIDSAFNKTRTEKKNSN